MNEQQKSTTINLSHFRARVDKTTTTTTPIEGSLRLFFVAKIEKKQQEGKETEETIIITKKSEVIESTTPKWSINTTIQIDSSKETRELVLEIFSKVCRGEQTRTRTRDDDDGDDDELVGVCKVPLQQLLLLPSYSPLITVGGCGEGNSSSMKTREIMSEIHHYQLSTTTTETTKKTSDEGGGDEVIGYVWFEREIIFQDEQQQQQQRESEEVVSATTTTSTTSTTATTTKTRRRRRRENQRRAVIVGINEYPRPNELHGCVADCEMVHEWLLKFGWKEESIQKLCNSQATGEAIENAIKTMLMSKEEEGEEGEGEAAELSDGGDCNDGDDDGDDDENIFFFSFSGHGTMILFDEGTNKERSETAICPVDLDWKNPFTSRKLHQLLKPAIEQSGGGRRRNTVILFMDCCHSGTMGTKELDVTSAQTTATARVKIKFLKSPTMTTEQYKKTERIPKWGLSTFVKLTEGKRKLANSTIQQRGIKRRIGRGRGREKERGRISLNEEGEEEEEKPTQKEPPQLILVSACQDDETAADVVIPTTGGEGGEEGNSESQSHGAFTFCWNMSLQETETTPESQVYGELLSKTKTNLRNLAMKFGLKITQTPNLVPLSASSMKFATGYCSKSVPQIEPASTTTTTTTTSSSSSSSSSSSTFGEIIPIIKEVLPPQINIPNNKRGSVLKIWKDDPTTQGLGIREIWFPWQIKSGPSDSQIQISNIISSSEGEGEGTTTTTTTTPIPNPNSEGNFEATNEEELEPIHCFGVIRSILDMYERYLRSSEIHDDENWKLKWAFTFCNHHGQEGEETEREETENKAIQVYPRAGWDANAYYSREEQALKFFYFSNDDGKRVYTSHSFDVVAHETGHAILDSIQPLWMTSEESEEEEEGSTSKWSGAIHESFGDLTAIIGHLAQLDVCETLVTLTRGNLCDDNALCLIAPQFGRELLGKNSLRNANNSFKMSDIGKNNGVVENEEHSISQILTGAFYKAIVGVFSETQNAKLWDVSETLFRVGKKARLILMYSFVNAPKTKPTFGAIAMKMLEVVRNKITKNKEVWERNLMKEFSEREILDSTTGKEIPAPRLNHGMMHTPTCGTIRRSRKMNQQKKRQQQQQGVEAEEEEVGIGSSSSSPSSSSCSSTTTTTTTTTTTKKNETKSSETTTTTRAKTSAMIGGCTTF